MKKMFAVIVVFPALLVLIAGLSHAAPVGDDIIPGEIRADATFEHIGALWWIEGDDDLDSAMTLEFRRQGEGYCVHHFGIPPDTNLHSLLGRDWNQVDFGFFVQVNIGDFDGVVEQRDSTIPINNSRLAQAKDILGRGVGFG